jgi:plasmid stabilization system protein ParE
VKRYKVIFLPRAESRLGEIEAYLTERSSQAIAERFVAALVDRALKLDCFPRNAAQRPDARPERRSGRGPLP